MTVAVLIGALIGLGGAAAKLVSGGAVQTCVAHSKDSVRFVKSSQSCHKNESRLLIDQHGVPGKTGKTGKTGSAGGIGKTGVVGTTGPAGPANAETVLGPVETVLGSDDSGVPTGETAVSTATCSSATNPANVEAYGGGVNVVTDPQTQTKDIVEVQSSYPGDGPTGSTGPTGGVGPTGPTGSVGATLVTPTPQGQPANAWSAIAVVDQLEDKPGSPDSATIQAYVNCGP